MTNNLERWGAELAMLLRREVEQRAVLADTLDKIEEVCKRITTEPTGTLYGAGTGEHPELTVERNAVGWAVTSPAEWAHGTSPVQKPRNQAPVPMARPMRDDHQDGGSTFRLTPIADSTSYAITETLPAVVSCPGVGLELGTQERHDLCPEVSVHVHTADGDVKRVAEL